MASGTNKCLGRSVLVGEAKGERARPIMTDSETHRGSKCCRSTHKKIRMKTVMFIFWSSCKSQKTVFENLNYCSTALFLIYFEFDMFLMTKYIKLHSFTQCLINTISTFGLKSFFMILIKFQHKSSHKEFSVQLDREVITIQYMDRQEESNI